MRSDTAGSERQSLRDDIPSELTDAAAPGASVSFAFQEMSDGVALRIIEFTPPEGTPDAPPILFVPGWISFVSGWTAVLRELTAVHRVVYMETREKVTARIPRGRLPSFEMDQLVSDLEEVVSAHFDEGEQYAFMASSLGSTLILDYLGRGATAPLVSILIAPNAVFRLPAWVLPAASIIPIPAFGLLRPVLKWYLTSFMLDAKAEPEQAARYRRSLDEAEPLRLRANARALSRYAVWDRLPPIESPVCVVTGESDALHHRGDIDRIIEMLPDARLEVMASNRETHSERAGRFAVEEIARRTG